MDEVQSLLQRIDGTAPSQQQAQQQPPQRTKLVFLYSDEDEDMTVADATTATANDAAARVCAVDSAPLALHVADSELVELQTAAEHLSRRDEHADNATDKETKMTSATGMPLPDMPSLPFVEDTTPTPLPPRMRTVRVAAGGLVAQPPPRWRRHLTVHEVTQTPLPRRVRFDKDDDDDGGDEKEARAAAGDDGDVACNNKTDAADDEVLQPVVSSDGVVRAVTSSGGYCLTVDESELLDEHAVSGDADDDDDGGGKQHDNDDDNGQRQDDDDEDDEEEAEEDEEAEEALDEALVVAIAEQLLRCCTSAELDPAIAREAGRFTSVATPLLQQLYDKQLDTHTFAERIDADLRRFSRVYRSVYRPREAPVVIDGVVMDF